MKRHDTCIGEGCPLHHLYDVYWCIPERNDEALDYCGRVMQRCELCHAKGTEIIEHAAEVDRSLDTQASVLSGAALGLQLGLGWLFRGSSH